MEKKKMNKTEINTYNVKEAIENSGYALGVLEEAYQTLTRGRQTRNTRKLTAEVGYKFVMLRFPGKRTLTVKLSEYVV